MMATAASPLQSAVHYSTVGIVFGVVGIVFYICARIIYKLFLHPLRSYPGPLLWRISSIPYDWHAFHGTLHPVIKDIHRKYGPVVRLQPNDLSYIDSGVWKEVWSARNPEFPKDMRQIKLAPNGAYNILNAPTDLHAKFRRLLANAFSEKGLRDQQPRIQEYVDLLVERLGEKAKTGESTDIVDWYTNTVFDVIGDLAFGESFNGLQEGRVHEWIPAILGNLKVIHQSNVFKRLGLQKIEHYFIDMSAVELRKKNYIMAAEKVKKRADFGGERGDFWDRVLIKSKDDNKAGDGMTQDEMVNNASVLMLGGAETSATILSGTTYLLLKNPAAYAKLVHEIRSSFSDSAEIDVYSVSRLTYMLACLDEAMREYPPVPGPLVRTPPRGGGFVHNKWIPETTAIHFHQVAANHSETNFHRPDEYCPERWLNDAPEEFAQDDKAACQPFSVGNRNCIGRNLAYAEMRLVLAKLLFNFDIELDEEMMQGRDWFDQKAFGVWFKGSLHVKLREAKRS